MPDELEIDDVHDDPTKVTISREALQNIRGAADRNAEREAEAEKLRRENVLLRAGINLEGADDATKQRVGFLVNGWPDGTDFTVDAVKAAAEGLGILGGSAAGAGPEITPDEQQQTADRQLLQPGSTPAGSVPDVHPSVEAVREGLKVLARGGTDEDAIAVGINTIVRRAVQGTAPQLIIRNPAGEGEAVQDIVARKGFLHVSEALTP